MLRGAAGRLEVAIAGARLVCRHIKAKLLALGVRAHFEAHRTALLLHIGAATDAAVVRISGDRRCPLALHPLQGDAVLQLLIVRKGGAGSEGRECRGDDAEFRDGFHVV